jgi:hypothetical protein
LLYWFLGIVFYKFANTYSNSLINPIAIEPDKETLILHQFMQYIRRTRDVSDLVFSVYYLQRNDVGAFLAVSICYESGL